VTHVQSKIAPRFFPTILLAVCLALAGCSLTGQAPAVTATPSLAPRSTLTATPTTPLTVLVIPPDMSKADASMYETAIYTLAQANGMRFQVLNSLTPADIQLEGPSLKVVVAFPPDPGLAALVAAAPQIQFLAIGIPNLPAATNLSTLGATGQPVDREAFLAGYMAALVADDFRVGIITLDDTNGLIAEQAFANGMHFYCGLCRQQTPPQNYIYPVHPEIKADAPESSYPAYAVPLQSYLVSAAYVYPPVATPDLLEYLVQHGFYLIGEEMLSQDMQPNWVASLKPELLPAIQAIFPDLVAGKGGQIIPMPLSLADVNPNLLSEGKQRLVQQVLDGLQAGTISTGITP
jgi:hypothetical protein